MFTKSLQLIRCKFIYLHGSKVGNIIQNTITTAAKVKICDEAGTAGKNTYLAIFAWCLIGSLPVTRVA